MESYKYIKFLSWLGFSINDVKLIINSTFVKLSLIISSLYGFISSYFLNLTLDNNEQYLAITAVILLDGFFGIWAGSKNEGFKTHKAIKILKNLITWWLILTTLLMIESGISGTDWLSETVIIPFIIFELISALKNASMAGLIKKQLVNDILDSIDKHKGIRK